MTARARLSPRELGARELGARELGARELAGYRVLRSLARDDDAEVMLGHRSAPASPDGTDGAAAHTVAIKVWPASDPGWDAALRECAALERARGDHVVDLLDLDSDEESIRLLFERLPRGDLSELLRVRPQFDAGEAVTLLAPLAVTLLRMHAAGVAHGHLSARTVLFRDDGSPTLTGFSRAELFEPGAPEVVLEQIAAVRRDRAAARALAVTVLGRVHDGRARAARELHDDLDQCDDELILPLLAARVFEVAAAVPVRFTPDEPEADAAPSGPRAVPVGAAVVASSGSSGGDRSTRMLAVLRRVVPEPWVQRVLDTVERSPAAPVVVAAAGAVRRRWTSSTPGRRRVVLAVGAAALTVGVVTAVVPAGAGVGPGAVTSGATGSGGSGGAGGSRAGAPTAEPGSTASAAAEGVRRASDPALTADDVLAATRSLVRARDRCLVSLSVLCLDQVDEARSGAFDGDQAAIRGAQQGGELPDPLSGGAGDGPPVLIERLGDSALVRLGEAPSGPSILLVKGATGWRIRDVIAAGGPSGVAGG